MSEGRVDIKTESIARVYAEALLIEAGKRNVVDEIAEQMDVLVNKVARADPLLANFFLGGVAGREHRKHALTKALEGRVNPLLLNFLLVLNDHERVYLLRAVLMVYRDMLEERANKVRVRVRSAVPLPDDQRERLLGQLRELTRKEPVLDAGVDPDLLGGLVVQIGDWRYDASVRHQLESIRNQLIERSSHVIEAG
jgi:F-type H+-transporting ATPase subunit delta